MILSSFLLVLELPIPESFGGGNDVTSGCAPSLINQFIVFVSVSCCMFRGQRTVLPSGSSSTFPLVSGSNSRCQACTASALLAEPSHPSVLKKSHLPALL